MKTINDFKGIALTRNQMRMVKGGATCAARSAYDGTVYYNLSKEMAQHVAASGGNWCCDSCDKASWY